MEHIISCHYSPDKGDGKVSAALATISYNITDAFTSAYNGYTSDTSGLQLISAKKTVVCHKTGLWLKHLTWLLECSRCSTSNQCSRDWLQLRSSYSYIGAPSSAQLSSDLRVAGVTVRKNKSRVNQLLVWTNDVSYSFYLVLGPQCYKHKVSLAPLMVTEDPSRGARYWLASTTTPPVVNDYLPTVSKISRVLEGGREDTQIC